MSSKKILVVFGATGNQGGSVVRSIMSDPSTAAKYDIRAVTRDSSKPAAAALSEKGVTVIEADLDDKDSLRPALKDAYAVFAVTNFHEKMSKDVEVQQGKNVADVAKESNIQHLIWSSLPHVSKITNNTITGVQHNDGKAEVEEYMLSLGLPYTALLLGIFMPVFLANLQPLSTPRSYKTSYPISSSTPFPLISAPANTGSFVKAILSNRASLLGKRICAAERYYSFSEICQILKEEAGLEVVYEQCTEAQMREAMKAMGFPAAFEEDQVQNMRFITQYGFFGDMDIEEGHQILTEPLLTFREFVANSEEVAALK